MNSNWNSEFFDRYLRSECSEDECTAFEKALKNSKDLTSEFEEFREYKELINQSKEYSAPENFTDNVIREIRKKADTPSTFSAVFKGLFRREIIGVTTSILILAVLFWPHMQSVTTLDESTILEELSSYQPQESIQEKKDEVSKEITSAPEKEAAIDEAKVQEKRKIRARKRKSKPSRKGTGAADEGFGAAASAPATALRSEIAIGQADKVPQRTVTKSSSGESQLAYSEDLTLAKKQKRYEDIKHSKQKSGIELMEEQRAPSYEKKKLSKPKKMEKAEVVTYSDSYEMESIEMVMSADLDMASAEASQFPEPSHRGVKSAKQAPQLKSRPTQPSDSFPFEKYHAVVTGTDTLSVTIPRRYLRRLSRDWVEYGGTVLDTVENDSTVILKLIK